MFEEVEDLISLSHQFNSENSGDEDILKEWNPLLIAIFYGHIKVVKYYCDKVKVNMIACLRMPGHKRQRKQQSFSSIMSLDRPVIITFLLEVLKYNIRHKRESQDSILMYFWEFHGYLFSDLDLKLLVESLFKLGREDLLYNYIFTPASVSIIKALPFEKRLVYLQELQYIGYQSKGKQFNNTNSDENQQVS